jgi:ABC-type dipeptide/oligopeptide/nickel transport system ATPase component
MKTLIINIRGNSGSGKTHLMRQIMKQLRIKEPMWFGDAKVKRPHAMVDKLKGKYCVIGSYDNACGGCDTIKTQAEVVSRVQMAAALGFKVIFLEGLIMSTIYGTVGEYSEQFGDRWVFAYLDTPIEACIHRVKARRIKAGKAPEFNETNTRNRVNSLTSSRQKCLERGRLVLDLPHKTALQTIMEFIRKEKLC